MCCLSIVIQEELQHSMDLCICTLEVLLVLTNVVIGDLFQWEILQGIKGVIFAVCDDMQMW